VTDLTSPVNLAATRSVTIDKAISAHAAARRLQRGVLNNARRRLPSEIACRCVLSIFDNIEFESKRLCYDHFMSMFEQYETYNYFDYSCIAKFCLACDVGFTGVVKSVTDSTYGLWRKPYVPMTSTRKPAQGASRAKCAPDR
jgi:hypothetical protein